MSNTKPPNTPVRKTALAGPNPLALGPPHLAAHSALERDVQVSQIAHAAAKAAQREAFITKLRRDLPEKK